MLWTKANRNRLANTGWFPSDYQPGGEGVCIECYANRWVEWFKNEKGKLKKVVWGQCPH